MPDGPTIYDFPFMEDADARAQARAMAQALRRQQMQGLQIQALTGGPRAGPAVGQQLAQQGGQEMGLGTQLLNARMQRQEALARMREQQAMQEASQGRLFQQQTRLEQMREAAQARSQEAAERRSRYAAEEAFRRAMALTEKKGELVGQKPLTETQGQAAMFLKQGESALEQAMAMGRGIFPATGAAGGLEAIAWKARRAGVPQLSSKEQQARQSLLLAIAEPIVRAESGAAVPETEVARLATRYIPMPGETKEEHQRKLGALINAIEAVGQKLPEHKAAEFRPFYEKARQWAKSYVGETPSSGGPKVRKFKRGPDGKLVEVNE